MMLQAGILMSFFIKHEEKILLCENINYSIV